MTQTAPKVPWLLSFQQKDLLTACWGSEKEANLLYHFLNKASWEAKNQGLESCKVIPFKEEHDKILKLVPMAEGTLIKYLKRFNLAGYVSSGHYGSTFTVNVDAIKAAFTNPPEKPMSAPRGRPKGFKVSRIKKTKKSETSENNGETSRINEEENTETLKKSEVSRISEHEEVSRLKEKVLNLELLVLNLKEKVLNLELLVLNLKLSETRESTPEAAAGAKVSLQNDLEMIQIDSEREGTYSERESETPTIGADAPTPTPQSQDYRPDLGYASSDSQTTPEDTSHGHTTDSPAGHQLPTQQQRSLSHGDHTEETDGTPVPAHRSTHTAGEAGTTTSQQATTGVATTGTSGYEKPAQATSQAAVPRRSARQAPAFSPAPLFAPAKPARPTLTEGGKLVRDWYQLIRATKVRLTDVNINACNGLSEEDGISFETLKTAIEHWESDGFVKKRGIAIDLQQLEKPDGAFTFAKAQLLLHGQKKPASATNGAPKPATKPDDNPYSLANMMASRPLPTLGAAL